MTEIRGEIYALRLECLFKTTLPSMTVDHQSRSKEMSSYCLVMSIQVGRHTWDGSTAPHYETRVVLINVSLEYLADAAVSV